MHEVDDAATLLNRTVLGASDARVHSDVLLSPTSPKSQGTKTRRPTATRLLTLMLEFVRCTHVVHSRSIVHLDGGSGRNDSFVLAMYVIKDLRHQLEARTHVGEG